MTSQVQRWTASASVLATPGTIIFRCGREGHHMQADVAMHERMEQRMMAKVRAAEQALLDGEFNILASSPLGRAQVERFAALNARIQELEGLLGPGAKVIRILFCSMSARPTLLLSMPLTPESRPCVGQHWMVRDRCLQMCMGKRTPCRYHR